MHLLLSEEDIFHTISQHTHINEHPEHPLYMVPLVPRTSVGSAHYHLATVHKNTPIN